MAKILLVEDDNNLREIYEARLQAEGYTIVSARDGEEALVVAKAEKPDLVISDIMMPKISGFEMLDILRNTDGLKEVKVIMLTALGQSDDQTRATKLGADRYLVKSQVTLEDIVKVTHELLGDSPDAPGSAGPDNGPAPSPTPPPTPTTPSAQPTAIAPPPATNGTASASSPDTTAQTAPASPPLPAAPPEPASATTAAPAPPKPKPDEVTTAAAPATAQADSPKDSLKTDSPAQSTAQEEASVESQIEDFVAGATTDAPGPLGTPSATPPADDTKSSPAVPASDDSEAEQPTSGDSTTSVDKPDDKPAATTEEKMTGGSGSPAVSHDAPPVPTVIKPDKPAARLEETSAAEADEGDTAKTQSKSNTRIANKKVIEPLDTPPKKDIATLLALEETKQAASRPPAQPIPVVGGDTGSRQGVSDNASPQTAPPLTPGATISTATAAPTASPSLPPAPPEKPAAGPENPLDPANIAL